MLQRALFAVFSFHKGKCWNDLGRGGGRRRVSLAQVFKHPFDIHVIIAAGAWNLSELITKALPQAVQEFGD